MSGAGVFICHDECLQRLEECLEECKEHLEDADGIVEKGRMVKDEEELDKIRQAAPHR